jgi:uncharacterized protein
MGTPAQDSAAASRTTEAANKRLVAEFMEVFSTGETDAILGYLADSAT